MIRKIFVVVLFFHATLGSSAQEPRFIFKNDPVFSGSGTWNMGVERRFKTNFSWQTQVSVVQTYGNNQSSFGNPGAYLMTDPQHQFNSLKGFSAQLQCRKYVNQSHWMNGAFLGLGAGHWQEVLNYSVGNNVTPIQFKKQQKSRGAQFFYVSGYQSELKKWFQYSVTAGLGFNTHVGTDLYQYEFSGSKNKKVYGILQFSMMTPVYRKNFFTKDTVLGKGLSIKKSSIWINPLTLFARGPGVHGGLSFTTGKRLNWSLEGWFFDARDQSNFFPQFDNGIAVMRGFKAGLRQFTSIPLQRHYTGLFAEYNHLEVNQVDFFSSFPTSFVAIKDQFAFGIQYGYIFMSKSGIFADLNGNSGIRVGNQPHVDASMIRDFRANFNNGVFNKIFIRVGYAF